MIFPHQASPLSFSHFSVNTVLLFYTKQISHGQAGSALLHIVDGHRRRFANHRVPWLQPLPQRWTDGSARPFKGLLGVFVRFTGKKVFSFLSNYWLWDNIHWELLVVSFATKWDKPASGACWKETKKVKRRMETGGREPWIIWALDATLPEAKTLDPLLT